MRLKKLTAVALTATLTIGSLFTGTTVKAQTNSNQVATYAEDSQTTAQATTGDYIADSYEEVESGHVFESVTQERLLDILSSKGNYYIVFAGPEHKTSKATIAKINEIAKKDGITKIYHFINIYHFNLLYFCARMITVSGSTVNCRNCLYQKLLIRQ